MLINNILKSPNAKWIISALILVCVGLGLYNGIFSIVGLIVCACAILICTQEDALFILFFIMSFANIFKISPTSQSFFTYVLLFFVLYQIIMKVKLDRYFLVTFMLFLCVLSIQFLVSVNILRTIKFINNILFIYISLKIKLKNPYDIFKGYIAGIIIASSISWFDVLPNISSYLERQSSLVGGVYINRFSGLYSDPNYYAVNLIIGLCLVVILYHKKMIKIITFVILASILFCFAILTFSKSVFLMLILPMFVFLYSNSKNRHHFIQLISLVGISIFVIYMLAGKVDFLSVVSERLLKGDDLNALTTGRYELWILYYEYFSEAFYELLLGNGLGAELIDGKAPHNTYIDILYYLGILGSGLLMVLLFILTRINRIEFKRNILNYSVLFTMLLMYFFLSQLFYFDLPFHVLLAIMVLNVDMNQNLSDKRCTNGKSEIDNLQGVI